MAPKRNAKPTNVSINNISYNNLTIHDVLCPICRNILIEPVTLPCNHGFCLACFDGTMANTKLTCPLCRLRIGSWLRTATKTNTRVNNLFWNAIKKTFPTEVTNKLKGIDQNLEEEHTIHLAEPGVIRREYEKQKAKEEEEFNQRRQIEIEASEAYIKQLTEQEEREKAAQEAKLKLDEHVAKKLAEELGFDPGPSNSKTESINVQKKGPMDAFLKNMSNKKLALSIQPIVGNRFLRSDKNSNKEFTTKILNQGQKYPQSYTITKLNVNKNTQNNLSKKILEIDGLELQNCYFKPIMNKSCHSSINKVPAIKVPAIVATATTVIIGAPSGNSKFTYNCMNSAFVEFSSKNIFEDKVNMTRKNTVDNCKVTFVSLQKVKKSRKSEPIKKQQRYNGKNTLLGQNKSKSYSNLTPNKKLYGGISPPFYGFNNTAPARKERNGIVSHIKLIDPDQTVDKDDHEDDKIVYKRKRQEESDLEYAKKLHREINILGRYSTRNSITRISDVKSKSRRQATLHDLILPKFN